MKCPLCGDTLKHARWRRGKATCRHCGRTWDVEKAMNAHFHVTWWSRFPPVRWYRAARAWLHYRRELKRVRAAARLANDARLRAQTDASRQGPA